MFLMVRMRGKGCGNLVKGYKMLWSTRYRYQNCAPEVLSTELSTKIMHVEYVNDRIDYQIKQTSGWKYTGYSRSLCNTVWTR